MKLPKRIILVRHGESKGNIDRSTYTTTPCHLVPLTELGREQARTAGENIRKIIEETTTNSGKNWKVQFYVSPFVRTRQTLRELGKAFEKKRIIGVTEECRIREQGWGNFRVEKEMKVIEETRLKFGRFFFRYPEGESVADVYDRVASFLESLWGDIHNNRLQQDESDEEINLVIVAHGSSTRVMLMKLFGWTVEQFEYLKKFENGEIRTMQLGSGGEYSLAVHHSDEELEKWGLSQEMISDQRWRLTANKGEWNKKCSLYRDGFFDHLQHSSDDNDNENDHGDGDGDSDDIINHRE
ncbi:hypothetical protein MKX03_013622 [Papaver bracteatum]|nr:hypothetical protein MKX03_013622 [Papaver bracteatum]